MAGQPDGAEGRRPGAAGQLAPRAAGRHRKRHQEGHIEKGAFLNFFLCIWTNVFSSITNYEKDTVRIAKFQAGKIFVNCYPVIVSLFGMKVSL